PGTKMQVVMAQADPDAAVLDLFDLESAPVHLRKVVGVKSLKLFDVHLGHNFKGVGSQEWGVGKKHYAPFPAPDSPLPTPHCFFPVNVPSPMPAKLTLPFIVLPSVVPA